MNSAFFHKERKAVFVMASLAIWFAMLALFGPYLPANAMVQHKRLAVNLDGQQITGEWTRKKGSWTFKRVVEVKKITKRAVSQKAVASNRDVEELRSAAKMASLGANLASQSMGNVSPALPLSIAEKPVSQAPVTTASLARAKISESASKKTAARAVRSKLAEEIGRWAKIGDRWEWHKQVVSGKRFATPKEGLLSEYTRWQRRDGFWMFDAEARLRLFLNI